MLAVDAVGVVLAGGRSSRMGVDKAALCLGGEPLLLRAKRRLYETGLRRLYLSGCARLGWNDNTVPDLYPSCGPVGGMVSVLQTLMDSSCLSTNVLFVPVDAPLISSVLLSTMLQSRGGDGCCVEGTPLPVLLHTNSMIWAQCEKAIEGFLEGRSCSVKQFIAPLDLVQIKTQPDQLLNVNTPLEWEAFCCEFENRT